MKKKFNIHPSFDNEYLNYKEQELLNKMRKKQQRELRQLQFKEERQIQEQYRKHIHQQEEQIKQQYIQENIRKKKEQSQQYKIQREIQKLKKVSSQKELSERNYYSQEDILSNRSKTNSISEKSLIKKIAESIQSQQQCQLLNKKLKINQNLKSHEQLLQERKEAQLKEQIKLKQLSQLHLKKVHQRYQEELDFIQLDRNEKWNNYEKKWSELMSQQAQKEKELNMKKREKAKSMQLLIDHKDKAEKLLKQTIDEKLQKINSKNEKINKFVYEKNYLHDLLNALEQKQKSSFMKYYN